MRGKKDSNQDRLVELWNAMGCHWIPTNRYGELGFDGILISSGTGKSHIVEIKSNEKYELTKSEKSRKQKVESAGGVYNIIWNEEQAANLARS